MGRAAMVESSRGESQLHGGWHIIAMRPMVQEGQIGEVLVRTIQLGKWYEPGLVVSVYGPGLVQRVSEDR